MDGTPDDRDFPDDPDLYDSLFDWEKRLANEGALYRRVFEEADARSVLDVACGTGRHAAMFRSWGLRVEGADLSPAMIEHCRSRFGTSGDLRWVVRSFEQPPEERESFDAAVCAGNSLALAPDLDAVRRAVGAMLHAVRPGGVIVVHLLNLWRLPDGPTTWQRCVRRNGTDGQKVLLKGVRRSGSRGYVELIEVDPGDDPPRWRAASPRLLVLEGADLAASALENGAEPELFGDFRSTPYARDESPDLILVASKR